MVLIAAKSQPVCRLQHVKQWLNCAFAAQCCSGQADGPALGTHGGPILTQPGLKARQLPLEVTKTRPGPRSHLPKGTRKLALFIVVPQATRWIPGAPLGNPALVSVAVSRHYSLSSGLKGGSTFCHFYAPARYAMLLPTRRPCVVWISSCCLLAHFVDFCPSCPYLFNLGAYSQALSF